MKRALVVGLAPARSSTTGAAAFAGSASGARLERLIGLQPGELLAVVDTVNLSAAWPGEARPGSSGDLTPPRRELRDAARRVRLADYRSALLCGEPVARAFGIVAGEPIWRVSLKDTEVLVIPHPSGASRWWNDRANRLDAARAVRELLPDLARTLL